MRRRVWIGLICSAIVFLNDLARFQSARAADGSPDLSSAQVKDAIEHVQKFLGTIQNRDGSFGFRSAGPASYYGNTGVTGLVVLALLSSRVSFDQPLLADRLKFLPSSHEPLVGF